MGAGHGADSVHARRRPDQRPRVGPRAALFALADAAFEVACNGYGRVAVGLDVSLHYAAVAEAGQVLVADAVEVTRSKRVASYRVDVSAADGRTRCSALAVAFRTDHWHLGVEAWPAQWRERY